MEGISFCLLGIIFLQRYDICLTYANPTDHILSHACMIRPFHTSIRTNKNRAAPRDLQHSKLSTTFVSIKKH